MRRTPAQTKAQTRRDLRFKLQFYTMSLLPRQAWARRFLCMSGCDWQTRRAKDSLRRLGRASQDTTHFELNSLTMISGFVVSDASGKFVDRLCPLASQFLPQAPSTLLSSYLGDQCTKFHPVDCYRTRPVHHNTLPTMREWESAASTTDSYARSSETKTSVWSNLSGSYPNPHARTA